MKKDAGHAKRKQLKLGDIIEIRLGDSLVSYCQYIYKYKEPPHWGALIRVFATQYESRPQDFDWIDHESELFTVFCPIVSYVNRGIMTVASHRPLPSRFARMPLFRAAVRNITTGKCLWWVWDGKTEQYLGELDATSIKLPIRQLIDIHELKLRISTQWTSAQDI